MDYQFKKFPVFLVKDFRSLSSDAKILYMFMLDRRELSIKNGWKDENGTYIIFTLDEVDKYVPGSKGKASIIMKELRECGLITRKRRGQGNPDLIYFTDYEAESNTDDNELSTIKVSESKDTKRKSLKNETQEFTKESPKDTDNNYTDSSYLSITLTTKGQGEEKRQTDNPPRDITKSIAENAGLFDFPDDPVNGLLVDIIREVMAGDGNECVKINGLNKPKDVIRSCFSKIDRDTISYFYYRLANYTDLESVKNKRSYFRSMLYNACFEGAFTQETDLRYGT